MNKPNSKEPTLDEVANLAAHELDADIIIYNGPIERPADTALIDACIARRRRTNALMILVTTGGNADCAYRIARCLQRKYKKFVLYVSGYCKSAGTLVALGAHELVISDHGELGPLDVQMSKKDELWEMQSGLTVMDTLSALQDNALNSFEKFFLEILAKSGGTITLKTAAQIGTEMTTGLFRPLYSQVDPLHIGEAGRAMSIAGHYGKRLLNHGGNIGTKELEFIMSEYPSHGFVIDRQEANTLFKNVREPTEVEILLANMLSVRARWPEHFQLGEISPFNFLSSEPPEVEDVDVDDAVEGAEDAQPGNTTGTRPGDSAEAAGGESEGSNGDREPIPTPDIATEIGDDPRGTA